MSTTNKRHQIFKGCFPANKIPFPYSFPAAYIINKDLHNQIGSHWVAIYVPDNKTIFYFDSYARKPKIHIFTFLKNFPVIYKNFQKYQYLFSDCCAHFCIYFIVQILKGLSFNEILSTLSDQPNPDLYVYCFVKCLLRNHFVK
jgi:hypothetical protein